jgi:hypothetical protein
LLFKLFDYFEATKTKNKLVKKVVKTILVIIAGLVVLVVIGAATVSFRGIPKYEAKKVDVTLSIHHNA